MAKEVKKVATKTKKNTTKASSKKKPVAKTSKIKKTPVKKKSSTNNKKKTAIKRPVKKKVVKKTPTKKTAQVSKAYEALLVENFVSLQKVMTNLSMKFSELSQNISKMLFVFEEAAKNLSGSEKVMNDEFGKKVDNLVEQNKTISKNLGLMDEKIRRQGQVKMPVVQRANPTAAKPAVPQKVPPQIKPNTPNNPQGQTASAPKSLPQI